MNSFLKGCLDTELLLDNTLESLALCFLQRHKGTGDFAESLCTCLLLFAILLLVLLHKLLEHSRAYPKYLRLDNIFRHL